MKKKLALLMGLLVATSACSFAACGEKDAKNYKITIACDVETGETVVMKKLVAEYEAMYPDRKVEISSMAQGFQEYMNTIAQSRDMSAQIIWTTDSLHGAWDDYYVDLRPYYEQSAETDYSLYYETMLDTTGTNGKMKPTKNYKGEFRSDDLDTVDGKSGKRSEYGMYYAPRDYNKPAILCNMHAFAKLDTEYEKTYKAENGITQMPESYQSTTARVEEIIAGVNWDEMADLYAFAKEVATRIYYLTVYHDEAKDWESYRALNLFLDWEPTYTTVMYDLGVDLFAENGEIQIAQYEEQLKTIRDGLVPSATDEDKKIAPYLHSTHGDEEFSKGTLLMRVCSRPVIVGYGNTFSAIYGTTGLQTLKIPTEYVAAGNSGYAISRVWENKGVKVNGVYKSYTDLSWDFIKFIITKEGQEVAGATGLNIPVLKSLYDAESNGGVEPAWRQVANFASMDHDAWVAGKELKQDLFNIYQHKKRPQLRNLVSFFFMDLQKQSTEKDYLKSIIDSTTKKYNKDNGAANLVLGK